ncbi:MAG TPA: hypothetical protein VH138_17765 [Vicinamibacterales bacterium]|jgi:hypothetical protein|nr:hypothetical protein [Vicinamibacterales bacterium]
MRFAASRIVLTLALTTAVAAAPGKPKLTVKANPTMAFSPARVVVSGDLTGGVDNDQQLYCLGVEWEWGDGTKSEDSADCEPFETAKSEIKRHFTAEHTFRMEEQAASVGQQPDYRDVHIQLRLKKSNKVVVSGGTTVKIKPEMAPTAASRLP